jgi:glycerate 2-kinase
MEGCAAPEDERDNLPQASSLREADSGRFLAAAGDLLHTGPAGTNVMDIPIGLRL